PLFEFSYQTLDPTFERLQHEGTILGLGDGGAHCRLICDSSLPTFMLTHWTRDRTKGHKLSIEEVIKLQTLDTATIYGLSDRGSIQVGKKADINIIDYDGLSIDAPKMIYDLPTGAPRLLQEPNGYKATIVSGQVVRENGEFTGVRPGVVIRGRR
ncbi:MAG TPA: amidohydrolase, partial [Gammaproteobacteria bacterium]|nr:amidohydrolase [Gammaproteobacteria bacterium]